MLGEGYAASTNPLACLSLRALIQRDATGNAQNNQPGSAPLQFFCFDVDVGLCSFKDLSYEPVQFALGACKCLWSRFLVCDPKHNESVPVIGIGKAHGFIDEEFNKGRVWIAISRVDGGILFKIENFGFQAIGGCAGFNRAQCLDDEFEFVLSHGPVV